MPVRKSSSLVSVGLDENWDSLTEIPEGITSIDYRHELFFITDLLTFNHLCCSVSGFRHLNQPAGAFGETSVPWSMHNPNSRTKFYHRIRMRPEGRLSEKWEYESVLKAFEWFSGNKQKKTISIINAVRLSMNRAPIAPLDSLELSAFEKDEQKSNVRIHMKLVKEGKAIGSLPFEGHAVPHRAFVLVFDVTPMPFKRPAKQIAPDIQKGQNQSSIHRHLCGRVFKCIGGNAGNEIIPQITEGSVKLDDDIRDLRARIKICYLKVVDHLRFTGNKPLVFLVVLGDPTAVIINDESLINPAGSNHTMTEREPLAKSPKSKPVSAGRYFRNIPDSNLRIREEMVALRVGEKISPEVGTWEFLSSETNSSVVKSPNFIDLSDGSSIFTAQSVDSHVVEYPAPQLRTTRFKSRANKSVGHTFLTERRGVTRSLKAQSPRIVPQGELLDRSIVIENIYKEWGPNSPSKLFDWRLDCNYDASEVPVIIRGISYILARNHQKNVMVDDPYREIGE